MEALTIFFVGMAGSSAIEIIAFFLGIIAVALVMFRSIWNFPFGIAMVTLYGFIFYEARLYSDMLLQVFFFGIQVYGWWYWLQGNMAADGHIKVRLLARDHYKWYGGAALLSILVLGTLMARFTNAALPYPDATTTVLSVIAQILLARRYLENWVLWIIVDVMAIFIYNYKELYPTTVLYAIFLGMAISGYYMWKRMWNERVATEGVGAEV